LASITGFSAYFLSGAIGGELGRGVLDLIYNNKKPEINIERALKSALFTPIFAAIAAGKTIGSVLDM